MKKIVSLLLLICVLLSLFSFVFLQGQTLSFKDTYTETLSFVTDIGNIFEPLKNIPEYARYAVGVLQTFINFGVSTLTEIVESIKNLPTNISDIKEKINDVISKYPALQSAIETMKGGFDIFANKLETLLNSIREGIKEAFDYIWDKIADFLGICSECGKLEVNCEGHYDGAGPGGPPGSSGGFSGSGSGTGSGSGVGDGDGDTCRVCGFLKDFCTCLSIKE